MIMEMNLKRALAAIGRSDITVRHIPLSEANSISDELYVVGLDIAPQMKDFKRVIIIRDMVSTDEFVDKLTRALESADKRFRIE
jgi:PTS system ascorbate-specific IIB component